MKVISCNQTRYKPTVPGRAVDRRADLLQGEYLDTARAADQKYKGVLPGQVGAVERKLVELGEVRGVVARAFGAPGHQPGEDSWSEEGKVRTFEERGC